MLTHSEQQPYLTDLVLRLSLDCMSLKNVQMNLTGLVWTYLNSRRSLI